MTRRCYQKCVRTFIEKGMNKEYIKLSFLFLCVGLLFIAMGARADGMFRNTNYHLALEADDLLDSSGRPLPKDVAVLNISGSVIAMVTAPFFKNLTLEGSGKLVDGRVVNFARRVNGTIRFESTLHAWGRGVGNCPLNPWKTIAVDPTQIALGSKVLIEETQGMKLPDGSIHDGIWMAEDTGGAILKDRIDLFIANVKDRHYLSEYGIVHLKPLFVKVIAAPAEDSCVHQTPQ